ncbi:hypothetical protein [Gracilibacillus alcaliphilus]|uniref:hypothetical protein n=1 Tax=Gracilibacillus alcaliphilus TaxID=1401441 RepID=UPI00195A4AD1|nr:hypothetical protein [Gracilibacillus alcaliphilus]MBM7678174.1 anionic cell wall polymer biosynthesis LytR-Cps2A-Psr (LCP) family protein [Gracilibacillus alcaliphilus]
MSIKKWVVSGILYVVVVFAGYSLITGNNPFQSGELEQHDQHSNSEIQMEG